MRIFVGSLSFLTTSEELAAAFAPYGTVQSADVVMDRETGESRGFGFVEMPDKAQAERAIEAMNGAELGGRRLTVNEARPRTERPAGRGRW